MLFVPGSAARFLAFALIFFAEGLGLELVPVSCEIFESVEKGQYMMRRKSKKIRAKTYSTACSGAGSSTVKYGCSRTSLAEGLVLGS